MRGSQQDIMVKSKGLGKFFNLSLFIRLPCGSAGKECTYNAGDLGSIPGLGISPGEGNGNPLCREPARGIPPVTRSCGRDLMCKVESGFSPGIS